MDLSKSLENTSKYLRAEDVGNKEFTLQLRNVFKEELGVEKEVKDVVYFHGAEKGMVLNRGNTEVLVEAYGADTDLYDGKPVIVYTEPTKKPDGTRCRGLRLRIPPVDATASAPVALPVAAPVAAPAAAPVTEPVAVAPADADIPF